MGLDYYAILNVHSGCTTHDVCLAYVALATATHPRRKMFPLHPEYPPEGRQESATHLPRIPKDVLWQYVNEAYDVLVNPLYRDMFDLYGEEGLKRGAPVLRGYVQPYVYHGNCLRTYHDAIGSSSPFVEQIDAAAVPPSLYYLDQGVPQDPPIVLPLTLDLKDVYYGNEQKHLFYRHEFSDHTRLHTELRAHYFTIPIRRGIRSGCEIKFSEAGDRSPFKRPSDVVFIVHDSADGEFRRDGSDLHWTYDLDWLKAMRSFVIKLNTVDGRTLLVPIKHVKHPEYVKCVPGEGLPTEADPAVKGDLCIHFNVAFPTGIPRECKEAIANSLIEP